MRIGLGLAVRNDLQQDRESTTFAAVLGAVVDALSSAAGMGGQVSASDSLVQFDLLKKTELQLHYDGFEIQNVDITLTVRKRLPESLLASLKDKMRKPLFLDREQLVLKQYVMERFPYELHVQAMALIG